MGALNNRTMQGCI